MEISQATVDREEQWMSERGAVVVPLANEVRSRLSEAFGVEVGEISTEAYRGAVEEVFADPARGVNIAALVALLRDLDIHGDYPGFVVDEYLGMELAAMIAGDQPLRLLAQATFHFADIYQSSGETAGADDLDAALAAGFQTRLPGWDWRDEAPFEKS